MAQRKLLTIDLDWIQNPRQFNDILSLCMELFKNKIPTIFIKSHHEIYNHINEEEFIINIDHHHDFGYEKFQSVDEGNWLFHLANVFTHKINYTWISNPTSDHVYWINTKMHKLKSFMFDHNINYIRETNFDKIFLCCSPDHAIAKEAVVAYKIVESIVNENKKSES
jgi:hypothetical protein